MFTRNTLTLGGAAMCGALLLSGCANHMSQRSEHEERIERKLLAHSLQIDVGSPAVLELPQRRVRINEQKTFEVTEFDGHMGWHQLGPMLPEHLGRGVAKQALGGGVPVRDGAIQGDRDDCIHAAVHYGGSP